MIKEFSCRTRQNSLDRFKKDIFDLLVIGGGITGAATAREASRLGLNVALVEKEDFAFGTSSKSSKLIHGGLRYLETLNFHLVFEALSERHFLLRNYSHLVKPLPFYFPIYQNSPRSRWLLSCGLMLYDFLALFRTPGFHQLFSASELKKRIPSLVESGLQGGFLYYDASMWDDGLTLEVLREASELGAAVVNYFEATEPEWEACRSGKKRICGFNGIRAHQVIACTGPWIDQFGLRVSPQWQNWLKPSKGIHLVFDSKRFPLEGSVVMFHPTDGRIAFALPRADLGTGVVIVGTTDEFFPEAPEKVSVQSTEISYLLTLLQSYFPNLKLKESDIISTYAGVRPLIRPNSPKGSELPGLPELSELYDQQLPKATRLHNMSREHEVKLGAGGIIYVAGGKFTTHRKMAQDILKYTLRHWRNRVRNAETAYFPRLRPSSDLATQDVGEKAQLIHRYRLEIKKGTLADPEGFEDLGAKLLYSMRHEMVYHLEDFYFRRSPLFLSRKDHGLPWLSYLAEIMAYEKKVPPSSLGSFMEREITRVVNRVENATMVQG